MAKKAVATLRAAGGNKSYAKCIKMVKSEKTGAYIFKTETLPVEGVKDYFAK